MPDPDDADDDADPGAAATRSAITNDECAASAAAKDPDLLDHVTGLLLGDDVDPEPESPWERRQRKLDALTATILGVAAFLTAWATFQAAQWSDQDNDASADAATLRSYSVQMTTEASQSELIDTQMWLRWVEAIDEGRTSRATFLRERFSDELELATRSWIAGIEVGSDGLPEEVPEGTPMDLPVYQVADRIREAAFATAADAKIDEANEAGAKSMQFVLLAVVLAMVLLLASIATKFTEAKVQALLILASIVMLAFSVVRLILLDTLL